MSFGFLGGSATAVLTVDGADAMVSVDAYGAAGNCPLTGSTAGARDDTAEIQAAFDACPAGGVVVFTPGKCYAISDQITCYNKSLVVVATGATIRARDASIYKFFLLGGNGQIVDFVEWHGGELDANIDYQYHFPCGGVQISGDYVGQDIIFTDAGIEPFASYTGTPRYTDGLSGRLWRHTWLTGEDSGGPTNPEGRNLKGAGNQGFITISNARRGIFDGVHIRALISEGLSLIECWDSQHRNCTLEYQLPTNLWELENVEDANGNNITNYEEVAFRITGFNTDGLALFGKDAWHHAQFRNLRLKTCALAFFARTNAYNNSKSKAPLGQVTIENVTVEGAQRYSSVETARTVNINNLTIYPANPTPGTGANPPALFLGESIQNVVIDNSEIYGRLNVDPVIFALNSRISNTTIIDSGTATSPVCSADVIDNCYIETTGGGPRCRVLTGRSRVYAEGGTIVEEYIGPEVQIGRERPALTVDRFVGDGVETEFVLTRTANRIDRVEVRRLGRNGGQWLPVAGSQLWSHDKATRTITLFADLVLDTGDELRVHYVPEVTETFTRSAATNETFVLAEGETFEAGQRAGDIISVKLDGVTVPHRTDPSIDIAVDGYWSQSVNVDGNTQVFTKNTGAGSLEVVYIPAQDAYGEVSTLSWPAENVPAIYSGSIRNVDRVRVRRDMILRDLILVDVNLHGDADAAVVCDTMTDFELTLENVDVVRTAYAVVSGPGTTGTEIRNLTVGNLRVQDHAYWKNGERNTRDRWVFQGDSTTSKQIVTDRLIITGPITVEITPGGPGGGAPMLGTLEAGAVGNLVTGYALYADAAGSPGALLEGSVTVGRRVAFTSGGATEIVGGNTITGATSGATATVKRVTLTSGTWAGGDAAGYLYLEDQSGVFGAENLNVGAATNLATVAGDSVDEPVHIEPITQITLGEGVAGTPSSNWIVAP